jgi:hypothetical protein
MKTIFREVYDDESLYDLGRDVSEALDPAYNDLVEDIPQDVHGFRRGSFTVTIVWDDEQ